MGKFEGLLKADHTFIGVSEVFLLKLVDYIIFS